MDGPVVTAARAALDAGNVNLILPYVPKAGEQEVVRAFKLVLPLHKQPNGARQVADLHFFETVVRVHRAGEGASFTGLKPAGLNVGPVIPIAEKAIESESPDELIEILTQTLRTEVKKRFERMLELKKHRTHSVDAARAYVEAMLGLQVYSHQVYSSMKADPHGKPTQGEGHEEHHH
jgi:hypothetical protein